MRNYILKIGFCSSKDRQNSKLQHISKIFKIRDKRQANRETKLGPHFDSIGNYNLRFSAETTKVPLVPQYSHVCTFLDEKEMIVPNYKMKSVKAYGVFSIVSIDPFQRHDTPRLHFSRVPLK